MSPDIALPNGAQHGEYRTYQIERKAGLKPCDECRKANNAYVREWRGKSERAKAEREANKAYGRALWRLSRLHPAQFRALVDEERRAVSID